VGILAEQSVDSPNNCGTETKGLRHFALNYFAKFDLRLL